MNTQDCEENRFVDVLVISKLVWDHKLLEKLQFHTLESERQ